MKKFCYWLFLAVMLFATMNGGCGGSSGGDVQLPQTQTQTSDTIQLVIDDSESYTTRYKALYARETGGEWVRLAEGTNGSFDVNAKYKEFGFEFDITDRTNWLFSDTVYKVSDSAPPQNIIITMGGTEAAPTIEVKVDGRTVLSNNALTDTNPRYDWGAAAGDDNTYEYSLRGYGGYRDKGDYQIPVYMDTVKRWFAFKSAAFYGREPGGNWVCLKNGKDLYLAEAFYVSSKYVEFGFEFDITWGTDWPYSNVFWTAAQTEQEAPTDINIEMGGTVRMADIEITVNGKTVVDVTNCDSHNRYPWW